MSRRSLISIFAVPLGLVALTVFGYVITRWVVEPGIQRYNANPVTYEVARRAHRMTWIHRDHPLQRLLTPASQIVEVKKVPGHCRHSLSSTALLQSKPNDTSRSPALALRLTPSEELRQQDYRGRVQFYTLFAIPVTEVYFTCGGASVSNELEVHRP